MRKFLFLRKNELNLYQKILFMVIVIRIGAGIKMEIAYIANIPVESWNIEFLYRYVKWTNFFEIYLFILFEDFKKK